MPVLQCQKKIIGLYTIVWRYFIRYITWVSTSDDIDDIISIVTVIQPETFLYVTEEKQYYLVPNLTKTYLAFLDEYIIFEIRRFQRHVYKNYLKRGISKDSYGYVEAHCEMRLFGVTARPTSEYLIFIDNLFLS